MWELNTKPENLSYEFEKLMNLREQVLQIRNAQEETYQEIMKEKENFKTFFREMSL